MTEKIQSNKALTLLYIASAMFALVAGGISICLALNIQVPFGLGTPMVLGLFVGFMLLRFVIKYLEACKKSE